MLRPEKTWKVIGFLNDLPVYDVCSIGGVKRQCDRVRVLIHRMSTDPLNSQVNFGFLYRHYKIFDIFKNGLIGTSIGYNRIDAIRHKDKYGHINPAEIVDDMIPFGYRIEE